MTSAPIPVERPWVQRLYDRSPVPPWAAALGAAFLASVIFLGAFWISGRLALLAAQPIESAFRDLRISLVCIVLIAYLPAASWYVARGARRNTVALLPLIEADANERRRLAERAGHYSPRRMRSAGLIGLAIAVLAPLFVDRSLMTYDPRVWSPEMLGSRATSWLVGWWGGQFVVTVLTESSRLSELASRLREVDLFDLQPLTPFTRQGLIHALLAIGSLSIFTLFLVEGGFGPIVVMLGAADAVLAGLGLLLPLRGVHRKIRAAKQERLALCRTELRRAHDAMAASADEDAMRRVADLLTYRRYLERVREWPFDVSTLVRFAIYLLIPLLSWAGGALVERGVDRLLD